MVIACTRDPPRFAYRFTSDAWSKTKFGSYVIGNRKSGCTFEEDHSAQKVAEPSARTPQEDPDRKPV